MSQTLWVHTTEFENGRPNRVAIETPLQLSPDSLNLPVTETNIAVWNMGVRDIEDRHRISRIVALYFQGMFS